MLVFHITGYSAVVYTFSAVHYNVFSCFLCSHFFKENNLKTRILCVVFAALCQGLFAQGTLYTFVVNITNDGFPLPLVGVVNIAHGNHSIAELGVLNINTGSFFGIQAGVINFTGADLLGLSAGVVNVSGSGHGAHAGVANISFNGFSGLQTGVLNFSGGDTYGIQAGVVNFADTMTGAQIGLINIVTNGENTVPIGLLPIVLQNGYYALELSIKDLYPVNVSVKMGVKKLYTSIGFSYDFNTNMFYVGGGMGTIIDMDERLFFNVELNSHTAINHNGYLLTSAEPALGFNLTSNLSLIAGPLIEYEYIKDGSNNSRFFKLAAFDIDESSAIVIGAKAALRFRL